ncbi:MAG: ferrochelatase [Betaproteobacteria bacterium]|nr:ferrochelatase [Betaproteobacteria bacterium]
MPYRPEPPYAHGTPPQTGILLVNLGTPDEATPAAVRRYLKQFLSDPRVVEIWRPLWWLILNGIILNTRPKKTAKKYESIWKKDGSPLRLITERQAQMLRGYLGEARDGQPAVKLPVVAAMRYGNPSVQAGIDALKAAHCDRILVLPLYPQYAASTTASTMDEVGRVLAGIRNVPGLRVVRSFHDHPMYVKAIARNVMAEWTKIGRPDFKQDKLVMSFHGLPKFHLDRGDPYHCQCHKSARLIADELGVKEGDYLVTFQSRFGRAEWLQPYTDKTLEKLGKAGTRRLDIIAPGFAADCLETLEELAVENRNVYLEAGGKEYHYIPVANDTQPFVEALSAVARENLGGWIGGPASDAQWRESAGRAKKMGAPI